MTQDILVSLSRAFVGAKVDVLEQSYTFTGKALKNGVPTEVKTTVAYNDVAPTDPVFHKLETEAQRHGLMVRAVFPATPMSAEYCPERVSAHMIRKEDGSWTIGSLNLG
jgi:hypothetical protein